MSACENTLRAVEVCTDIDDWPRAQVNLSTWFKGEKTLPCGFEVCCFKQRNDMNLSNLCYTWHSCHFSHNCYLFS